MFSVLSAVLEPFLLIALGYALRGTKRFGAKELWDGVEKLVFWVLFPPLLFNSVAHAKLTGLDTAEFLLFGTFAMATGVFMAKAVSKMAPADPMTDASVRQTGYRFNSYICFALALNMYGQEALALVALLTGIWVPISNAIAVADWNPNVTHALLAGAFDTLTAHGVKQDNITVVHVPGTFELTFAAAQLAKKHPKPDAVIVLGCVIQGETPHFDYVCQGVTTGVTKLNADGCTPIIFGVLTTNTMQQALDRAGGVHGNKGVEAAITAIKMSNIIW